MDAEVDVIVSMGDTCEYPWVAGCGDVHTCREDKSIVSGHYRPFTDTFYKVQMSGLFYFCKNVNKPNLVTLTVCRRIRSVALTADECR